jgi:hypothetical protein
MTQREDESAKDSFAGRIIISSVIWTLMVMWLARRVALELKYDLMRYRGRRAKYFVAAIGCAMGTTVYIALRRLGATLSTVLLEALWAGATTAFAGVFLAGWGIVLSDRRELASRVLREQVVALFDSVLRQYEIDLDFIPTREEREMIEAGLDKLHLKASSMDKKP